MADFSQQYCVLTPYDTKAVSTRSSHRQCLVTVKGGIVTVTQAPSTRLYRMEVPATQVVVSKVTGKLGGVQIVDADHRWLLEFGAIYRATLAKSPLGKLKLAFGAGGLRTLAVARDTQRQFVDAMVDQGASLLEE